MYAEASEDNLKEADAASRRALDLDPELAEAHASRGLAISLSKHYDEAEREFQTALRLNARLFEAHYFYARACFEQGMMAEAARLFEQASRVNPEDYQSPGLLATAYEALGRNAEAQEAHRRSLQLIEKHIELHPDDARATYLGANSLCQLGDKKRSLEWAARALAMDPEESSILYNVACVYALQGQSEDAIDCLEKAVKSGFGHRAWIENDSDLSSLRSHPRFQALVNSLQS
jgi:tetratricopeptide (TPR) repeat protein